MAGSARGRRLTATGSADFTGDAKQSRKTLSPLGLYEGSDKGMPLRQYLDLVLVSWNRLIARGSITQNGEDIPAMPITSADMQGTKALYGQASSSHSVWCKCQRGPEQQFK